jgi:uncharacterized protein YegL
MKKGLTELVFIIDKSGSMGGLESDTIGGFNSMLRGQRELEGEAYVTTVLFDNEYELLHDRIDIRAVADMTQSDYAVRGSTALLDAMGKTIKRIHDNQKQTAKEYRAEKVIVVVITDGAENSSREYTLKQVRKRVEKQKAGGWTFMFLGANMDAVTEARNIGIDAAMARPYEATPQGVRRSYEMSCEMVSRARMR